MTTQAESAVSDVSEQPGTEQEVSEQSQPEKQLSFQDQLLKQAKEDGYEIGLPEPEVKSEEPEKPKPEEKEFETETEPEAGEKPEETKEETEEEKIAAEKKADEWPDSAKQRVAEETAKRKRAQDRADKAESLATQLQAQLAQATAPTPTEDNPLIDIQDMASLDRLERSYEKMIDLAEESPESLVEQIVESEKKKSGADPLEKFTPEQLITMTKRKAEKAIRRQIPERRAYLQQRATYDAQALEVYPEFKDPESEFTKNAAQLAQSILTGQAAKDPTLLIWIGRALKGWQAEQQRNGKETTPEAKTPEAKRIIESARTKIAPTPTKTRSFTERRSVPDLAKAEQELETRGDKEAALKYIETVFAQRDKGKRLEPIQE